MSNLTEQQIASSVANGDVWNVGFDMFKPSGYTKLHEGMYYLFDDKSEPFIIAEYFKPYKRPLSDLTKTIRHEGKEFVPILKIIEHVEGFVSDDDNLAQWVYDWNNTSMLGLKRDDVRWIDNKLKEWHFILDEDPNSVILVDESNNPYK